MEKETAEHKKYFIPSCIPVFILGTIAGILIARFDSDFIEIHCPIWFGLALLYNLIQQKRVAIIHAVIGFSGITGWCVYIFFT